MPRANIGEADGRKGEPHGCGESIQSALVSVVQVDSARLKRIQWRCRRGTRELDALLAGWLEQHGPSLDQSQVAAFDALLDEQDPELWDWLMGNAEPPRADWRTIVADIRRRAGLA